MATVKFKPPESPENERAVSVLSTEPADHVTVLREAFSLFDKNGDGVIETEEFAVIIQSLELSNKPTDSELRGMIDTIDVDGNGLIDFEEFVALFAHRFTTPQEEEIELRQSFRVFDKNGDGFITTSELRTVINSLRESPTDDELEAMIREADENGDGRVDFTEFVRMMMTQ